MTRLITTLATLAMVLVVPAAANASRGDRDHDRMPDRWERAHHLNTHRNDARRDLDRDGLTNLAEFRDHTDPRDADSDDDGVKDRNDVVGTVTSFTDGDLTITAPDGRAITAKVTPDTEVECRTAATTRHDGGDDDERGDDEREGDDDAQGEDRSGGNPACDPATVLVAGAKISEAELELTSAGAAWHELKVVVS